MLRKVSSLLLCAVLVVSSFSQALSAPAVGSDTRIASGSFPDVAYSDGLDLHAVAFVESVSSSDSDIRVALVRPDGTITNSGSLVESSSSEARNPHIACTGGSTFLVAWEHNSGTSSSPDWDIAARIVTVSGSSISTGNLLWISDGSINELSPDVGYSDSASRFLVAYMRRPTSSDSDVVARTVSTGGSLSNVISVSDSAAIEEAPTVTQGTDGAFGVAYVRRSDSSAPGEIYAVAVNGASGSASSPLLASYGGAGQETAPHLSDQPFGTSLLTWSTAYSSSDTDIRGRKIQFTSSGPQMGTSFIVTDSSNNSVASSSTIMSSNPSRVLIGWRHNTSSSNPWSATSWDVRGSTWNFQNDPPTLVESLTISSASDQQGVPSVAGWNGSAIVVYDSYQASFSADVYFRRVSLTTPSTGGLTVTPGSFSFSAAQGASTPVTQQMTITNPGSGTATFSISDTASWLTTSISSGSVYYQETVAVSASAYSLNAGTYTASITVSSSGSSATIPVTFTVGAGAVGPRIGLSTTNLSFSAWAGAASPAGQTVVVSNTGSDTLSWNASDNQSWMSLSPSSGTLGAGASQNLLVNITTGSLALGTYNGTISLTSWSATNSPQVISVALNVTQPPPGILPTIGLTATNAGFTAAMGQTAPASQTATIFNSGGGTLSWTASESAGWLSVTPASGSLPSGSSQALTLAVNHGGLAVNSYTTPVSISASGTTNSPQTISVSLAVNPPPAGTPAQIWLSSDTLAFNGKQSVAGPGPKSITIMNTGAATLSWSAVPQGTFVTVSPSSGSLASGATQTFNVSVNTATLQAGTYTGSVRLNGASNSPQTVSVTLTMAPPPAPAISLNKGSLKFTAALKKTQAPPAQQVSITNSGDAPMAWTASPSVSWLSVSPSSGSLTPGATATLSVSITPTGTTEGTYNGTVTVSAPGASSKLIQVALTMKKCGLLGIEAFLPLGFLWLARRRRKA